MSRLRPITAMQFQEMVGPAPAAPDASSTQGRSHGQADGAVVALDRPGVIATADGRFAKVFRRPKHLLSSARWRSYAARFADAAEQLASRGIPTVRVLDACHVLDAQRDVVIYQPLEGSSLRQLVADPSRREALLERFPGFLADLHQCGAHVRSMHWDNVFVLPDGRFALIDIAAARFRRNPIGPVARARDFRPFFAYEVDRRAAIEFGVHRLIDLYLEAASLRGWRRRAFVMCLKRQHAALRHALAER